MKEGEKEKILERKRENEGKWGTDVRKGEGGREA